MICVFSFYYYNRQPSDEGKTPLEAVDVRKVRELGSIGSALASTGHPYMAHIVPMRRCNLACTYCNEFDDISDPVPLDEMLRRIDDLGRLGTSVITISGGEPLLHPRPRPDHRPN